MLFNEGGNVLRVHALVLSSASVDWLGRHSGVGDNPPLGKLVAEEAHN